MSPLFVFHCVLASFFRIFAPSGFRHMSSDIFLHELKAVHRRQRGSEHRYQERFAGNAFVRYKPLLHDVAPALRVGVYLDHEKRLKEYSPNIDLYCLLDTSVTC